MYWTLSSLGKNLTDTIVTRDQATLVTNGPYRFVRHPFYVTAALLLVSITLLTASWFIGISGILVLALLAIRTPKEEQMLINRFGQQYRDYIATTGRYFPKLANRKRALAAGYTLIVLTHLLFQPALNAGSNVAPLLAAPVPMRCLAAGHFQAR